MTRERLERALLNLCHRHKEELADALDLEIGQLWFRSEPSENDRRGFEIVAGPGIPPDHFYVEVRPVAEGERAS